MASITAFMSINLARSGNVADLDFDYYYQTANTSTQQSFTYTIDGVPAVLADMRGSFLISRYDMSGSVDSLIYSRPDGSPLLRLENMGITFSSAYELDARTATRSMLGGNDSIVGSDFSDTLYGYSGNDIIRGLQGNDTIDGGASGDLVYGNHFEDLLRGDAGNDTLFGGQGFDTVYGGVDGDAVYGNFHNDILYGDAGNDSLYGGQDDDWVWSGAGDDQVFGNLGNDTLIGGSGVDWLHGGQGADIFFVEQYGLGKDYVMDFEPGLDKVRFAYFPIASGVAAEVILDQAVDTAEGVSLPLSPLSSDRLILFGRAKASIGVGDIIVG